MTCGAMAIGSRELCVGGGGGKASSIAKDAAASRCNVAPCAFNNGVSESPCTEFIAGDRLHEAGTVRYEGSFEFETTGVQL